MVRTSRLSITAPNSTLQKSAILRFTSSLSGRSVRQMSTSGWMPISISSRTECCVGFVFTSAAAAMYGTSVRCTNRALSRPTSWRNWRIASRNGSDSMSPTVPPISTITTSFSGAMRRIAALISSVMCGITCTVDPRNSPRRSLVMTFRYTRPVVTLFCCESGRSMNRS